MAPTTRLRPHHVIMFLAVVVAVIRANEAPDSVEDRLQKLESTVRTLREENAELRRALGAGVSGGPTRSGASPVISPGGREARLVIGGFLQAQAEFGDIGDARFAGAADRFYFRRARMYLAGGFTEHVEFKIEGEFGANSIAPGTGLRAMGNEIWVGWTRFPEFTVRVGQLKPAFGGEQLLPETRSPTVERYLGNDRLTDPRQLGVGLGGEIADGRAGYLVVVGNGNGSNVAGNDNSKFMHTARLYAVPFDNRKAGRLVVGTNALYSDDQAVNRPGFGFRSNGGTTPDNIFAGKRTGWGLDAMWHHGLLDVSAELLRVQFEPRNRLPASRFTGQGWELMAAYFVLPQRLQAVVRHESFAPDASATGDETNNWVVGLNCLLRGDDLRLIVDYMFGHAADYPDNRGRLLTRLQIIF